MYVSKLKVCDKTIYPRGVRGLIRERTGYSNPQHSGYPSSENVLHDTFTISYSVHASTLQRGDIQMSTPTIQT